MATTVTLQQLEYFLSAVEHGSLSAAAEAHYIAQPSLSDQIRRLERHLGVSLFHRTNRRLILTEAAHVLIPHAQQALRAAQEAVAAVDPIRDLSGGSVSFGTFSSAHHLLGTELITQFRARHPHVRLRVVGLNSVQVADQVRSGELEAGLVALPVDDRGLSVSEVVWAAEAVYLSRDPARTARARTLSDLAEASLALPEVRWGDADPTRRQLMERAQHAGVAIRPMVEVESPDAALAVAAASDDDTVISLPLAHALGMTDTLSWVSLDPHLYETFAFITRRGTRLSPATSVLLRLARSILAGLPHSVSPAVAIGSSATQSD